MNTQVRLLENSAPVLRLFDGNPFDGRPPVQPIGLCGPTAIRQSDGSVGFE